MGRAIDMLITYRVVKMLVTPFEKTQAYKLGIIDEKGKNLIPMRKVQGSAQKHYTILNRFVFNIKKIMRRVGLGGRLGSFGATLALLIKEDKNYLQHKDAIESAVITYLKEENLYDEILNESRDIPNIPYDWELKPVMTCFGVGIYEKNNKLISEYEYAKTL
jgi:hypothetical protein